MITKEWILKAKQLGKLTEDDSPRVIDACYQIFGWDGLDYHGAVNFQPKFISLSTQPALMELI